MSLYPRKQFSYLDKPVYIERNVVPLPRKKRCVLRVGGDEPLLGHVGGHVL